MKANYNWCLFLFWIEFIQRTILKELFESKLQQFGKACFRNDHSKNNTQRTFWKQTTTCPSWFSACRHSKNNTQRTFWKQTTTAPISSLFRQSFKEQYSKNFLKANYNTAVVRLKGYTIQRTILKELFESKLQRLSNRASSFAIQRTILKELFESKLQRKASSIALAAYSKNNTQRTFWKQTTTAIFWRLEYDLFKEQYSKNFLKANYNRLARFYLDYIIQRTILKELFESKLQLRSN